VQVPLDTTLMGLDTIHGPMAKNGGAAPKHILDVQLFLRFPLIPDELGHWTSSFGNDISLTFQGLQERPNWMLYTTWTSVLIWIVPG
jgi:hypothetical protein